MLRLRDLTIRTRLYALVIISIAALAAILCLSAYVLYWYRVDGPVHQELQLIRQLQTEMEPSILATGKAASSCSRSAVTRRCRRSE